MCSLSVKLSQLTLGFRTAVAETMAPAQSKADSDEGVMVAAMAWRVKYRKVDDNNIPIKQMLPIGQTGHHPSNRAQTPTEELPGGLGDLKVGDYVQQTLGPPRGRFRLPWYAFAPEEGIGTKINGQGAFKGTYFGPVHAIRDTRGSTGFVSIRVPVPFVRSFPYTPCQLVWINVCKCKAGDSWHSCERVSSDEVLRWELDGWLHKWIVDEDGAYGEHRIL